MNSPSSILDPGRPVARGRRRPPPLADSILGAIGNTPLVELRQIVCRRGLDGRILAKLEYLNPGSSKKDRVALEIVRRARADGRLRPGQDETFVPRRESELAHTSAIGAIHRIGRP